MGVSFVLNRLYQLPDLLRAAVIIAWPELPALAAQRVLVKARKIFFFWLLLFAYVLFTTFSYSFYLFIVLVELLDGVGHPAFSILLPV